MNLFLKIWKQENAEDEGHFETYTINNVLDSSFLEMLDQLNGELLEQKKNLLHLITIVVKEYVELVH